MATLLEHREYAARGYAQLLSRSTDQMVSLRQPEHNVVSFWWCSLLLPAPIGLAALGDLGPGLFAVLLIMITTIVVQRMHQGRRGLPMEHVLFGLPVQAATMTIAALSLLALPGLQTVLLLAGLTVLALCLALRVLRRTQGPAPEWHWNLEWASLALVVTSQSTNALTGLF